MFCTKTNLEIAQETFYFNEIIATSGTAAEIFEQLPKANLAHCHLMLKFAKWQMIDDE